MPLKRETAGQRFSVGVRVRIHSFFQFQFLPKSTFIFYFCFYLFAIFILHPRESEFYCYILAGGPHSLRSCHFEMSEPQEDRCLPHKGGSVPLSASRKDTTTNLPACSQQPPLNAERQAKKLWIPFLKLFWYESTRGIEAQVYRLRSERSNHYAIALAT